MASWTAMWRRVPDRVDAVALSAIAAIVLGLNGVGPASAQSYPDKPIKMIVAFAPGGPPDIAARIMAEWLSPRFGQVVVENRTGAGGTLASKFVAGSPPDGYTLLFGSSGSLAVSPALYRNLGYDPLKSFTPVAAVSQTAMALAVKASVPARTVQEFIAYAKANPGKLTFGAVIGTPPHLTGQLFKIVTGTDIIFVPYKGAAQATADVLAGQIDMTVEGIAGLIPHAEEGKLRILGIMSASRSRELPDTPTLVESGVAGLPADSWTGIVAPAGTPASIVNKLNTAINDGLKSAELKAKLAKFGGETNILSPQEFAAFMAAEAQRWTEIAKITGERID